MAIHLLTTLIVVVSLTLLSTFHTVVQLEHQNAVHLLACGVQDTGQCKYMEELLVCMLVCSPSESCV